MFDVVLVNPEIPPNTGNIGRLTLGMDSNLTIVGNPEFDLTRDAALKRAGLDYWEKVDYDRYNSWDNYRTENSGSYYLVTKFSETPYHEVEFEPGDQLIFGGENHGAPAVVHEDPEVTRICIPMVDAIRSFNVCNAVAIVLSEALRQNQPDWFESTEYSGHPPIPDVQSENNT